MQLDELNDLISDGRVFACEHVLAEVVFHLESRGFSLFEVVRAIAAITGKRGYQQAEMFIEDATNAIPNPSSKEFDNEIDTL